MKSTVLVTGGTGFIGSRVVRCLLAHGHRVALIKRSTSNMRRLDALRNKITFVDIDQQALAPFLHQLGEVTAVIHLATCYARQGEPTHEVIESNIGFPLRVLEFVSGYGCRAFLNTDTFLNSRGTNYPALQAYCKSKHQFADWGQATATARGVRFVNCSLEHVFGPADREDKFVQNLLVRLLKSDQPISLTRGEQVRDFIYVDDVAGALVRILHHTCESADWQAEYQIGRGVPVSLRSFAELAKAIARSNAALHFGALPYRELEVMYSVADTTKLSALKWAAQTSLESGLRKTLQSLSISEAIVGASSRRNA